MKGIILAGGSGTRLWPLSRKLMPKQFLKLFDNKEKSLFQKTVERNKNICDNFMVITNEEQYFLALDQIEETDKDLKTTFLLEEIGRNTAPAIALAALNSDEDEILFVIPADHLIKGQNYIEAVNRAKELANSGYLVTFGIKPIKPNTGYGYIEADGEDVKAFHEKPDLETAKQYLEKGNYYWNSGMFCFKAGVYLKELKKYAPDIYESCVDAFNNEKIQNSTLRIQHSYMEAIPDRSIDYAVMEKSSNIKVVLSDFEWNDIGSFDALVEEREGLSVKCYEEDSENNFYHNDNSNKIIATIGLKDFIVVDTNDALLIAKKGETQKVKNIVNKIKHSASHLVLTTHATVHRPWGTFETLIYDNGYKIKRIVVKPKKRLSLQKHFHRNEHWVVVSGTAEVQVGDKTYLVRPNESTYIKMGEIHRLSNPGKIPVVLIEAQVGEYTSEDDIVRIEDDYDR